MKDAAVETNVGANAVADVGRPAVEVLAGENVGTICLRGPCALCGQSFDVHNGQTRLVARDRAGNRLGLVCFRCTSAGEDVLRERLLSKAGRLKRNASRMERLVEGGIDVHPAAREAASAARASSKTGL